MNSAADELTLAILEDFAPEDQQEALNYFRSNGVFEYLDALDQLDDDGEIAADIAEWRHEDPESFWGTLADDDFAENVAAEADLEHEEGADDLTEQFDAATEALHEQADRDKIVVDESAFAPFIVAADGDLPAAYESYKSYFRTGAEPDLSDAFVASVDGDEQLAAEVEANHREFSTEARAQMRAERQENLAALKSARMPERPPSDELGIGDAVADLNAAMTAAKELREADAPAPPTTRESLGDALAGFSQ